MGPWSSATSLSSLDEVTGLFGTGRRARAAGFNIAPLSRAPIRTAAGLSLARWGLLPPWRGHGASRGPHVPHAPIDELDATPLLRNAFTRQRLASCSPTASFVVAPRRQEAAADVACTPRPIRRDARPLRA